VKALGAGQTCPDADGGASDATDGDADPDAADAGDGD
jgi:hypothetical protein